MNVDLEGKVIVVTGAASGIGAAIASQAARSGVSGMLLTDRDVAGLAQTADGIDAVDVRMFVANLENEAAPHAIAAACLDAFGRIDGLVNAAGLTDRGGVADGTTEVWDRLFAVNTRAAFFLMQAAIANMTSRGAAGTVVNILSMNAHCGSAELAIYAATKGALLTLTKNAANAHLADRIRVNGINLGWVDTPSEHRMQTEILGHGEDWSADVAAALPLGRLIRPDEAARLAVYLLSDASAPMTGVALDLEQRVIGAPRDV